MKLKKIITAQGLWGCPWPLQGQPWLLFCLAQRQNRSFHLSCNDINTTIVVLANPLHSSARLYTDYVCMGDILHSARLSIFFQCIVIIIISAVIISTVLFLNCMDLPVFEIKKWLNESVQMHWCVSHVHVIGVMPSITTRGRLSYADVLSKSQFGKDESCPTPQEGALPSVTVYCTSVTRSWTNFSVFHSGSYFEQSGKLLSCVNNPTFLLKKREKTQY